MSKLSRVRSLKPILFLLGFYLAAVQIAQTLLYTVVAYLVSAAAKTGMEFGNTVNEISGQYVLLAFALAALLLTVTTWLADKALYRHDPFWTAPHKAPWHLDRNTKKELVRGLSSGMIAAIVYLLIFTASGQLAFLGIYLTSTFGTPVFPLFFLDFLSLAALLVCEEFIFRHKLQKMLLQSFSPLAAVAITTALYLLVKNLQFQLDTLDLINLGLMSAALGFFFLKSGRAHRGIGFVLSLLCTLHSLAGLPLWDTESPSFFLFKPVLKASEVLSGARGAPFHGLGLTSILVVIAGAAYWTWRQDLEARQHYERITNEKNLEF